MQLDKHTDSVVSDAMECTNESTLIALALAHAALQNVNALLNTQEGAFSSKEAQVLYALRQEANVLHNLSNAHCN